MNRIDEPANIAALPHDHRGYPIPYVVLKDKDGKPDFVINDVILAMVAVKEGLCHICAHKLEPNPWFIGGPGTAILNIDRAVYVDGPLHHECAQFALKVCPHLSQAMKGPVNLTPITNRLHAQGISTMDNTVIPGVPSIFVVVQAQRWETVRVREQLQYHVFKPFKKTEYWQKGAMIDKRTGEKLALRAARELLAELKEDPENASAK